MNRTSRRAALAAACSLAITHTAGASPIYFDFVATITAVDGVAGAEVGATIRGGYTFETDRLVSMHGAGDPNYSFQDWQPANLAAPYAWLDFGGHELTFPAGTGLNFAAINFFDACRPVCEPQSAENFNIFVSSDSAPLAGFTGTMENTGFYFASAAFTRLPGEPFIQPFDYFDLAQVDATSIVSLPLYDTVGFYSESTLSCVEGGCASVGARSMTYSIQSVTRGIGARAVPEPRSLGLLAAGFAGLLLVRRRARAR
jgi:hypothetical protein